MDESTLIRHAANGDAAAWEPLVRAHQEAVFRLAYLLLGDPDDAEDITQETFVRAWNHISGFDQGRSLRPWLLSIAANLAKNRHRSVGRYVAALTRSFRSEPALPNVEERTVERMEANELWQAVKTMGRSDQQVVYLRFFLGLSVAETAEAMGIAEGTVKSRLSRALERLRGVIRKEFPVLANWREGYDS